MSNIFLCVPVCGGDAGTADGSTVDIEDCVVDCGGIVIFDGFLQHGGNRPTGLVWFATGASTGIALVTEKIAKITNKTLKNFILNKLVQLLLI